MTQISLGVSNSTVLMKSWASAPITAAGRKAMSMPRTKCSRPTARRQVSRQTPQLARIDAEDGEDCAELDQHLEGLSGRFEPEEMARQQDMPGRGNRNELRKPFQQAEHQRVNDRLIFHPPSIRPARPALACHSARLPL